MLRAVPLGIDEGSAAVPRPLTGINGCATEARMPHQDSFPVSYRSVSRITLGRWLFAFCLMLPQSEDARGNYSLDLHETGHRLIQSRCAMGNNQVMRENMRCFLDKQRVWEAAGASTHTLAHARTFGFGHERRALWRSV
ncbi:hypothetical protein NW755_14968 [Fusarium falciforme]|uniref:Uncharacterized protein n=1 Tax=Fusarium falciforme TaxID=195108 RepID=A0A9W8RFV8_9HYPO|nr:hypothetical protein NW755_14968 [Fusarium falciforme]